MTICLYGSPISTFARKVAIGLDLKGLPYDLVDALTPDRREELRKFNPRLEVPVLTDGDLVIVNPAVSGLALSRRAALSGKDRGARRRAGIRAAGRSTLRSDRRGLLVLELGRSRRQAAAGPARSGPAGHRHGLRPSRTDAWRAPATLAVSNPRGSRVRVVCQPRRPAHVWPCDRSGAFSRGHELVQGDALPSGICRRCQTHRRILERSQASDARAQAAVLERRSA
jgi:hypothetical protein